MAIGAFSKHPNAAKLMIKWMFGSDNPTPDNLAGYTPYYVPGDWAVRTDLVEPAGQKPINEMDFYIEDADWLYVNAIKVRDFWLQNQ